SPGIHVPWHAQANARTLLAQFPALAPFQPSRSRNSPRALLHLSDSRARNTSPKFRLLLPTQRLHAPAQTNTPAHPVRSSHSEACRCPRAGSLAPGFSRSHHDLRWSPHESSQPDAHFNPTNFSNSVSFRMRTPSSFALSYFEPGSVPTTT